MFNDSKLMFYIILSHHRYNRAESPGAQSTLSAIEGQLMNMFQRDFLGIIRNIHSKKIIYIAK